jgi:hypothetical protein
VNGVSTAPNNNDNNDNNDAIATWLADRDVPCPECGYNLRSSTGNMCPECGLRLTLRVDGQPSPSTWWFLCVGLLAGAVGFEALHMLAIAETAFTGTAPHRMGIEFATGTAMVGAIAAILWRLWRIRSEASTPKRTMGAWVLDTCVLAEELIDSGPLVIWPKARHTRVAPGARDGRVTSTAASR